ncbi:MAG: chemotaxis-specific protein-glutamate methyltransferase CheB, partial [Candidatus Hodarchaeota archaeon]
MPTALIAEDSVLSRKVIRRFLEEIDFKVVAEVDNGLDAVVKTQALKPDLVILDVIMPKMDGITALEQIMSVSPTKVLILSSFGSKYANLAFSALERGAIAFIPKPSGMQAATNEFKNDLQTKAKACLAAKLVAGKYPPRSVRSLTSIEKPIQSVFRSQHLIILGGSTGAPKIMQEITSNLRTPLPPIVVIQHLPPGFSTTFATRLNRTSKLNVVEAQTGMSLSPNTIYVAPGGLHLVFQEDNHRIEICLYKGDRVNGVIPSLEPTIVSASYHYEGNLTVIILTGMGSDGLAGVRYAKQNGATVIAQDEKSSIIYGMPKAIVDEGLADRVCNPKSI